ncbi:MAG: DUF937 domain-containing protein [Oscillospiraceae bacterium]|nr:DUF937 domain-containing protein [Oscillospiraceae bacterium]
MDRMDLLSVLLKTLLGKNALGALAKKTGLTSAALKKLIPLALPLLIKFLTKNASTENGALSLLTALGQHKDQKSLPEQIAAADETDGGKILGHIFGGDKDSVVEQLAAGSGLGKADVGKALGAIAPALLCILGIAAGKASGKTESKPADKPAPAVDLSDGLDFSDLVGLLGGGKPTGLLGGLFGKKPKQEKDDALNGNALLTALLGMMK